MRFVSRLFGILIMILLFLACGYAVFQLTKSRTFQFFGGLTSRVKTDQRVVALTFDDAPSPYSDEVLTILASKNIRVTFYVTGQALEQYPLEGKRISLAGHELGNHSYSHQRMVLKSLSFIDSEIQKTNMLIRDTGYQGNITFRPPNGKKLIALPWYLSQHNMKTIMWDVEPDTYAADTIEGEERTKFLVDYMVEHVAPGSIILLHPFCASCASDRQAIGQIIDALRNKGYEFVTVSKLLTAHTP